LERGGAVEWYFDQGEKVKSLKWVRSGNRGLALKKNTLRRGRKKESPTRENGKKKNTRRERSQQKARLTKSEGGGKKRIKEVNGTDPLKGNWANNGEKVSRELQGGQTKKG